MILYILIMMSKNTKKFHAEVSTGFIFSFLLAPDPGAQAALFILHPCLPGHNHACFKEFSC